MVADVTEELWEHAELQEQHETLGKDYQCLKGLYEKLQALPQDGEQPRVLRLRLALRRLRSAVLDSSAMSD